MIWMLKMNQFVNWNNEAIDCFFFHPILSTIYHIVVSWNDEGINGYSSEWHRWSDATSKRRKKFQSNLREDFPTNCRKIRSWVKCEGICYCFFVRGSLVKSHLKISSHLHLNMAFLKKYIYRMINVWITFRVTNDRTYSAVHFEDVRINIPMKASDPATYREYTQ